MFQIPGPLVREFNDRGQLAPVPESVYSAADIENSFVPWTIKLLKQEGKYVDLPTDVQSFLAFYNDDLFKEAGLSIQNTGNLRGCYGCGTKADQARWRHADPGRRGRGGVALSMVLDVPDHRLAKRYC